TMVYPLVGPATAPHEDMPEHVRSLYEEARRVAAVSRRAGAGMARTTLEYLLKQVLPEVGVTIKPSDRLDGLLALAEPEVSSGLRKRLEVVRFAGNKSVHVEAAPSDVMVLVLDEEDEAILGLLFQTVNDLVDELITRRKQTEDAYAMLPEGVLANIERKRAQRES
ncbi:MAG: DUF4145 domain-containing protein, partial [Acidobacteria bacterium]|nr:DUF4145 domain-containing protein [Acidobacteriota bacterium]